MTTRTAVQVKADFARKGMPIARWAAANAVSRFVVYQVLSGKNKGHYGEAHRVAVMLGLKDGEIVDQSSLKAAPNATDRRAA